MSHLRALFLFLIFLPASSHAAVYTVSSGDDLFGILSGLVAGDEVIVGEGTYTTGGFYAVDWVGTESDPIVVRAADGARPHIVGVSNQNIINMSGSHFTFRGFELSGGSHGIRLATASHGTLEDLVLHDLQDVGISCNRPDNTCDRMVIRGNEIYNTGLGATGEGMYLGCNDAGCTFSNSLVENNLIYNLGGSQGDGIEIKTGSFGNTVRHNVIIGAKYPAITMYGFDESAGSVNRVEGNFIWGTVDNGIQIVGQVEVVNNIIIDAGGNGIHSKPSQGFTPHTIALLHNTVVNAGTACLKTNDWAGGTDLLVANNALYCPQSTAANNVNNEPSAVFDTNVVLGGSNNPTGDNAGISIANDLGVVPNLYPLPGSTLTNAGSDQGVARDFNNVPRSDNAPDVGAYEGGERGNPGWTPGQTFKTLLEDPEPPGDVAEPGGSDVSADTRSDDTRTASPDTTGTAQDTGDSQPPQSTDDGCGCALRTRTGSPALPLTLGLLMLGYGWVRRTH